MNSRIMTVKELIEELEKHNPDAIVCTSDSEWGTEETGGIIEEIKYLRRESPNKFYEVDAIIIK